MRFLILNGPNLNLIGTRQPDIYGSTTLSDLDESLKSWTSEIGVDVETQQSNHEGDLIDAIQRTDVDGIVLNPGALTHTSRALGDAISAVDTPVVEVHISNVKEREDWRAVSMISEFCSATIYGRGVIGYRHGVRHLVNQAAWPIETISYGPDEANVGDLRTAGDNVVVVIHGGFWRHEWSRDTSESMAVDLAKRGFTTWNIEYRRIGAGGGWHETSTDVVAALDKVSTLVDAPQKVSVIGHSAGAHLAMWASQRSSTGIDQVIALAPVVDLERHSRSQMFGAAEAQTLLDGDAPKRVDPGDVPTLLVHGEADRHVPIGHSADLARSHGLELLSTPQGHFEMLDPTQGHWERVVTTL